MKISFKKKMVRILFFIFLPVRRIYWFIIRPKRRGVKCLIRFNDSFLFVHHSYGHRLWTIPGGGVKRNESFLDAAKRETKEETGIVISNFQKLGSYENEREHKKDTIYCYYAKISNPTLKLCDSEIEDASWISINDIPDDITYAVKFSIEKYKKKLMTGTV